MLLLPSSAPQPVASAHAYRPPLPLFLETRTGGREGERERERERSVFLVGHEKGKERRMRDEKMLEIHYGLTAMKRCVVR
jgi:hypothetical protein